MSASDTRFNIILSIKEKLTFNPYCESILESKCRSPNSQASLNFVCVCSPQIFKLLFDRLGVLPSLHEREREKERGTRLFYQRERMIAVFWPQRREMRGRKEGRSEIYYVR